MMKQATAAREWGGHRGEALFMLAQAGRKLSSLPVDLAAAVEGVRVMGDIVRRFAEMERSPLLRWLLGFRGFFFFAGVGFRGFRERFLADDLFLAKLAMEMGVGMIPKTAAEYQKRWENFFKEIDIAIADVGWTFPSGYGLLSLKEMVIARGERKMLLMDSTMILAMM